LSFCQGARSQQLAGGSTGTPRRALQAGGLNCAVPGPWEPLPGPTALPGAWPCPTLPSCPPGARCPVSQLHSDGRGLQSCTGSSVAPGRAFTRLGDRADETGGKSEFASEKQTAPHLCSVMNPSLPVAARFSRVQSACASRQLKQQALALPRGSPRAVTRSAHNALHFVFCTLLWLLPRSVRALSRWLLFVCTLPLRALPKFHSSFRLMPSYAKSYCVLA